MLESVWESCYWQHFQGKVCLWKVGWWSCPARLSFSCLPLAQVVLFLTQKMKVFHIFLSYPFLFLVFGAGDQTQGPTQIKQVFYCWAVTLVLQYSFIYLFGHNFRTKYSCVVYSEFCFACFLGHTWQCLGQGLPLVQCLGVHWGIDVGQPYARQAPNPFVLLFQPKGSIFMSTSMQFRLF